jgi:hypothetical protein
MELKGPKIVNKITNLRIMKLKEIHKGHLEYLF